MALQRGAGTDGAPPAADDDPDFARARLERHHLQELADGAAGCAAWAARQRGTLARLEQQIRDGDPALAASSRAELHRLAVVLLTAREARATDHAAPMSVSAAEQAVAAADAAHSAAKDATAALRNRVIAGQRHARGAIHRLYESYTRCPREAVTWAALSDRTTVALICTGAPSVEPDEDSAAAPLVRAMIAQPAERAAIDAAFETAEAERLAHEHASCDLLLHDALLESQRTAGAATAARATLAEAQAAEVDPGYNDMLAAALAARKRKRDAADATGDVGGDDGGDGRDDSNAPEGGGGSGNLGGGPDGGGGSCGGGGEGSSSTGGTDGPGPEAHPIAEHPPFHETQYGQDGRVWYLCGLHALNNLVGAHVFDMGDADALVEPLAQEFKLDRGVLKRCATGFYAVTLLTYLANLYRPQPEAPLCPGQPGFTVRGHGGVLWAAAGGAARNLRSQLTDAKCLSVPNLLGFVSVVGAGNDHYIALRWLAGERCFELRDSMRGPPHRRLTIEEARDPAVFRAQAHAETIFVARYDSRATLMNAVRMPGAGRSSACTQAMLLEDDEAQPPTDDEEEGADEDARALNEQIGGEPKPALRREPPSIAPPQSTALGEQAEPAVVDMSTSPPRPLAGASSPPRAQHTQTMRGASTHHSPPIRSPQGATARQRVGSPMRRDSHLMEVEQPPTCPPPPAVVALDDDDDELLSPAPPGDDDVVMLSPAPSGADDDVEMLSPAPAEERRAGRRNSRRKGRKKTGKRTTPLHAGSL